MSKFTKAVFIEQLVRVVERVNSLHELGKSEEEYVADIQLHVRSHGIFVGNISGLKNPIVYCVDQLTRSLSGSLTLRGLALIESAWEYYKIGHVASVKKQKHPPRAFSLSM